MSHVIVFIAVTGLHNYHKYVYSYNNSYLPQSFPSTPVARSIHSSPKTVPFLSHSSPTTVFHSSLISAPKLFHSSLIPAPKLCSIPLSFQPQNCVPDVIIWMLSGNNRVAVKRIPSHLLMYSKTAKARGKLCGRVQTIFLMVRHCMGTQAVSKLQLSLPPSHPFLSSLLPFPLSPLSFLSPTPSHPLLPPSTLSFLPSLLSQTAPCSGEGRGAGGSQR